MTLADHLSTAHPALADLLLAVADACVEIAGVVRRGGAEHSAAVSVNVQGEVQKGLDVLANDILIRVAGASPALVAMGSEEMDDIIPVRDLGPEGGYYLLFDPLDGSSNIDVNISVGTIFSILPAKGALPARAATEADLMQPGRNQVAAGYVVYGPQVTLVLTLGEGVAAFTLDPETQTWNRTAERMTVPARTGEYAINASNYRHWAPAVQTYVDEVLAGKDGPRGRNFNMRWVGSMVADLHRILTRGGVFLYPWDRREPDRAGKLRLMYEANPMSFLVAQAGGGSFDGFTDMLDVEVTGLHQRVSVMIGSAEEIDHLKALHAQG
ncbi:MAG: fbp2 [Caulobacter sp.]|nr:fbp2 [Caulobacter sp.]